MLETIHKRRKESENVTKSTLEEKKKHMHEYFQKRRGERNREELNLKENHTSPFSYCIAKSAAMKNV